MTVERVLDKARDYVASYEDDYVDRLVNRHIQLVGKHPKLADKILDEIYDEQLRLSPVGKYDEEEVIIKLLDRKGKKHGKR